MRVRLAAVLALVSLCAGCSGSANTTTAPGTTAGTVTETFASFVAIRGSSAHSFHVTQAGTIAVTLVVVTPAGVVGLGAGVPNASGSGCNLTGAVEASAAVVTDVTTGATTPQLTIPSAAGTYCVEVFDSGQLGGIGRTFSVIIAHS